MTGLGKSSFPAFLRAGTRRSMLNSYTEVGFLLRYNNRLIGLYLFSELRGARVLEIGCGMGLHTQTMAAAGAEVTAIDLTSTAVEATFRRLALRGLRAHVLQCDAENLPFMAGAFDFVWSWGVIHHSSRTARIVREIGQIGRAH